MKSINILFFASLRDITAEKRISKLVDDHVTIAELKKTLVEQYPNLKNIIPTVIVAMNHEYAFDKDMVVDGAEIAFFPPVSGG